MQKTAFNQDEMSLTISSQLYNFKALFKNCIMSTLFSSFLNQLAKGRKQSCPKFQPIQYKSVEWLIGIFFNFLCILHAITFLLFFINHKMNWIFYICENYIICKVYSIYNYAVLGQAITYKWQKFVLG